MSHPTSPGRRLREKNRSLSISPRLPTVANGVHDKPFSRRAVWTTTYLVPLPWPLSRRSRAHRIKIILPIPPRLHQSVPYLGCARLTRKLCYFVMAMVVFTIVWHLWVLARWLGAPLPRLPLQTDRTTRVFAHQDLRRIWEWEVASGHYQSSKKVPDELELAGPLFNPGLPPKLAIVPPSRFRPPSSALGSGIGSGLNRTYLDAHSPPAKVGFPPRPEPGSIADLDIIMDHCDYNANKYVRDCLEVLRVGAGLDNSNRVRRGEIDDWKYIYVEEGERLRMMAPPRLRPPVPVASARQDDQLEPPPHLSPPRPYWTSSELSTTCDPDHPRTFHVFWGGPFTDKPYMVLLSFLFTQNLGLSQPHGAAPTRCHPQLWVWMQTGLAREANPKPTALADMFASLQNNSWSAPFLHPRFEDVIKFKLWNTTEQLDSLPELKDDWRFFNLFNSGGTLFPVPKEKEEAAQKDQITNIDSTVNYTAVRMPVPRPTKDDLINRMGSTSLDSYDRMRTILSDMARFVLCHRYGGIYIDADTVFLRDWEELWGWKGAFAYRWSRLPLYNTAVLKLNKGSALGTFLLRTALRHGLDFHPMSAVSQYTRDAYLDGLLLRLPDALFDPAWLNTEYRQRDRPPTPFITVFEQFFDTPVAAGGDPQILGFDSFFRGAFSYHWHNLWWKRFDPARNWPDLGKRFEGTERMARLESQPVTAKHSEGAQFNPSEEETVQEDRIADDKRDLDWATVLKRTFEGYIRGDRPNMYGEMLVW